MKYLIGFALVITSTVFAATGRDMNRCGGEGPKPFIDITGQFKYKAKVLDAHGGVSEFLLWERKNQVVYRNRFGEVRAAHLAEENSSHPLLTKSFQPISPTVDENERRILGDEEGWLFRLEEHSWKKFNGVRPLNHVFWNRGTLYSVSTQPGYSKNRFEIFRFRDRTQNNALVCSFTGDAGEKVLLAEGHTFPKVFFYSTSALINGRQDLRVYSMDVRTCRVDSTLYENVLGPVENVYRFEARNALMVEVNHPRENLLWADETGCRYFDVDNLQPVVLNYDRPTIATWSPLSGLNLFYLDKTQKASLVSTLPIEALRPRDLRLSRNGSTLFMAPLFAGETNRWLLEVKVER